MVNCATPPHPLPRRTALRAKPLVILVLLAATVGGFYFWQHQKANAQPKGQKPRAVTVEMAEARVGDAPVLLAAIGQIVSSHSVAIRPQVGGTLTKVYFTEGDSVKSGQKLFEIDSAPYRAALAQAQAQAASAKAAQLAAEAQEKRLLPLADKGYVTAQEVLDAQAAAEQARASVKLAQAAIAAAAVNVERTVIRAPISGRTGTLSVKTGNIVSASDATPLITINQLDPVQAEFTVPQSQLAALQQAMAAGPVKIAVSAQTGGPTLAEGRVLLVDNVIDQTTGTVKLKAEFPNTDEKLWPGSFVSFTATLATEPQRVLVPELAVQPGAEGSFVYTVDAQSKAVLTPVKVARQIDKEVVIAEGLKGGEKIIARAPRDLKPGATVQLAGAKPSQGGVPGEGQKRERKPKDGEASPKAAAP